MVDEALWDVVVIGAGPAGAVSAALLAQRGRRVLLVERSAWPRDKACGGCLNAAGVRLLRHVGLGDVLEGAPPLPRFIVYAGRRRLSVPIPAGAAVCRRTFDAALVAAAERRGCRFIPGVAARLLPAQPGETFRRVRLTPHSLEEVRARVVLACDGLAGTSVGGGEGDASWGRWIRARAARIGVSTSLDTDSVPPGVIAMCVARDGYVGLVRQDDGRLHLGASLDPAACNRAGGALPLVHTLINGCGIPLPPLRGCACEGTPPLTARRAGVAGYRVLAVGDACGYVEPFTGEGMAWAIRGAIAVVELLPSDPALWPEELPAAWGALHHREIVRRQAWCRRLRLLLRHPAATAACLGAGSLLPALPALLARRIGA